MQEYRKFRKLKATLLALGLATITAPVSAQFANLNLILGISGNVFIKRVGSGNYQQASKGWVNVADSLRLEKDATATVLCSNFRRWKVPSPGEFVVEDGCNPGKKKINIRPGASRCCTRSPNNPNIPYIIYPRDTAILNNQVSNQPIVLRWNPVAGASRYTVSISGLGVNWEKKVSQSQVDYDGKESFKPGSRYWVTVTTDNGASSSSDDEPGFSVLSEEDSKKIKAEISQLQQLTSNTNSSNTNLSKTLSDDFKAFAEAELYHSKGLNAAAIDVLEGVIEQGSKTRAVYQRLGEIYQQVGLNRLAKQRYLTAVELAQKEQKLAEKQEKALIEYRLGEVNQVIGELKDSYQWYQAAQNSFRALGNREQARLIQQKLDYLKDRV